MPDEQVTDGPDPDAPICVDPDAEAAWISASTGVDENLVRLVIEAQVRYFVAIGLCDADEVTAAYGDHGDGRDR